MQFIEVNRTFAVGALPKRPEDSNKGSFGRVFAYVGSERYMGAMHLCLESMLRGGAGYVELACTKELWHSALGKFPELLHLETKPTESLTDEDISEIVSHSKNSSVTLIGCGSGKSDKLLRLILRLLDSEGGPIIIDADAINSIADDRERGIFGIVASKRTVILTPHPLEFSRLTTRSVDEISNNRFFEASEFARLTSSIVLLKGKGTVITDGNKTYINSSGSSALSKAGSGDCLAGLLASLIASAKEPVLELTALSAYVHGAAGDSLAEEFSHFGVTPSDLPREMARILRELEKALNTQEN